MKKTLIFLITTLSLISCVVKKPIYQNTSQLHSGAIKIYEPQYSVTKKKLNYKPFLVGMVITGLGGYGFYDLETNPNTQLKEKDKLGFGVIAGLGLTYMVAAILSKKGKTSKTEFITNNNFNDWLSKYNTKNNSNYVKLSNEGNSYVIIPKNRIADFQTEEDRLDRVAFLRVINGENGAYYSYISTRPSTSRWYNEVFKLRDECQVYYRAMYTELSETYTFNSMLSDCETYLKNYPQFKGNEIFFKNVIKKYNDILSIPIEVRRQKMEEIRTIATTIRERGRLQIDNTKALWGAALILLLSPSDNSTRSSNEHYRECGNCNGKRQLYNNMRGEYQDCSVCFGRGYLKD